MSGELLAVGVVAYLMGSVPSGYLLGRLHRIDVRSTGSGNIGATNVARTVGASAGALTLAIDVTKGALPVLLVDAFEALSGASPESERLARITAAICAVLGHVFSIFLRFRGGKGVATTLGALAALTPGAALVAIVAFAGALAASRMVSAASLVAAGAAPLGSLLLGDPASVSLATAALALLIAARHRENLGRIWAGTEPRLGARRAP